MLQSKGTATGLGLPTIVIALLSASLLAGCGEKKAAEATQVAARVNESDITVHQLNFRLQQDRNLRPENTEAATKVALDQLIDQELVVQKAAALKLDKTPRVLQSLEAARREVMARAYVEQIVQTVPKPVEERVRQYYDEHPELFSERRVYLLQEFVIEAPADKIAAVREHVRTAKSPADLTNWLKSAEIRASTNVAQRPAEQLPMDLLAKVAPMADGTGLVVTESPSVRVVFRNASRRDIVEYTRARPAIEQFLTNLARREAVDNSLKALRTAAKLEYVGKFTAMAASQPKLSTTKESVLQPKAAASGTEISLPSVNQPSAQISLPTVASQATGAEVSLQKAASGVEVSLSGTAASQVDAQTVRKALGNK